MQNTLTKQDVINIIKEFNTTQGGTTGGFTVPRHSHNGSDSLKVLMGDLALDSRGIIFPSIGGDYNVNIINGINGFSQMYISPPVDLSGNPTGSFSLNGLNGEVYRNITISSSLDTSISVGDMITSTNWLYLSGKTKIVSNSPDFVLNFPDINPLPSAPIEGDITFSNHHFYGCLTTGAWTLII